MTAGSYTFGGIIKMLEGVWELLSVPKFEADEKFNRKEYIRYFEG